MATTMMDIHWGWSSREVEDQAVLDLEGVEEGMASVGAVDHQVGEEDPHPEDLNTEF